MSNFKEFYLKAADGMTLEQIVTKGIELGYKIEQIDYSGNYICFLVNGGINSFAGGAHLDANKQISTSEFLALKPEDVKPKRFKFKYYSGYLGDDFYKHVNRVDLTQSQIDRIKAILEES